MSEIKKAEVQESDQQVNSSPIIADESEDVYYQFGGAALKEMLHNRYQHVLLTREARLVLKFQY